MKNIGAGLLLGLAMAAPAMAGFEAGMKALQAQDYATALVEARQGQAAGDVRATFLVFVILSRTALRCIDAAGKPDMTRYFQLAARPVAERTQDVEAYDALYRAAAAGFPPAVVELAALESGVLGEGNRGRMVALLQPLPPEQKQALASYESIAHVMDGLGQSYASPRLFIDTWELESIMAAMKACDKQRVSGPARVVLTAITTPLHDALFLPSTVPGYERAFLIGGRWQEEWTFQACGKTVALKIDFTADGMGGAYMSSNIQAARIIGADEQGAPRQ